MEYGARPGPPSPKIGLEAAATRRSAVSSSLLAAAIVACSFLYAALTMSPGFDTNDDPAMLGISIGLFTDGVADPHLVYQSALIGSLLAALARLEPAFDWYSTLQWIVCIGGFLTMSHVLLRRDASPLGVASVVVANSIFLPPFLFNLQFVQTSFVCLTTGIVLLVDAMRREPLRGRALAWALAWTIVAALYRSATLMAAVTALAVVALLTVADRALERDRPRMLRDVSILSAFALVLLALGSGASALERSLFYSDPGWREFYDHLSDRPYVLENWPRWIGLARIVPTLQRELGVTPEQYLAMVHWIPISKDVYAIERFTEMAGVIREIEVDLGSLSATLPPILAAGREFLATTPPFRLCLWIVALIAVLGAISNPTRRGRALSLGVVWIVVPCLLWLAIAVAYRPPPPRVWMSILLLAFWGSLACRAVLPGADAAFARNRVRDGVLALVALGLALAGPLPVHAVLRRNAQIRAEMREERCRTSREHVAAFETLAKGASVYLAPQVVNAECFIRPFEQRYPKVLTERTHAFGWRVLTPRIHESLFATDTDLFDAICRNPDNMFVANPPTQVVVRRYLRRHKPEVTLVRYAENLPETILACRIAAHGSSHANLDRAPRNPRVDFRDSPARRDGS